MIGGQERTLDNRHCPSAAPAAHVDLRREDTPCLGAPLSWPIGEDSRDSTSRDRSASPTADHGERRKYVDAVEPTLTKLGNVANQFA